MRHALLLSVLATAAALTISSCTPKTYTQPDAPIQEVPFTQVHIQDQFWSPRIETNRTVSIPSAFRECEKNGRFDNFAIAAGLKKGKHRGDFPFDDTDPYKIIEGASYSLAVKYDPQLDHYLDSVISIIAAAQEPDGYLTTCVTNRCTRLSGWWGSSRWEKINSHELYNSGHLYEAAVAHYRATGKRTLLDVAIKNADLVCQVFGPGENQKHVPSGHPIIEMALCKLYNVTGEQRYLDMARYFVEETGRGTDGHKLSEYSQDHKPILQQDEMAGHAVRAGYLYSGVADVASLTGDTAYFHALTRLWDNLAGRKLYITGGMGSRAQGEGFGPDYELPNHTAYCETCAAISNVYWNYRMFLATGDAKYMDVLERALYNGVISGVSLSGDKFFYDNPLESQGEHDRQRWFGCACCPGNITRFMASVSGYTYATQASDIYVNLYIQGSADLQTESGRVALTQTTDYPWNGTVTIKVDPEQESTFALRLRIPGWLQQHPVASDLYTYTDAPASYTLKVNGTRVKATVSDGYATISRQWKAGDIVELDLPMNVRRIKAHDKVTANRGMLALERGPVVYCLEGQDQPGGTVFDKYIPDGTDIQAAFDPELLGGITVLSGTVGDTPFKAIPYSTWNNRGTDQMTVWIPASAEYSTPVPEPTIASRAKAYSDGTPAWGVNDQWEPRSSSDIDKPYFYWWLKKGGEESLEYEFDQPYTVSKVQVYWLDFDHYDGNYRVPESWKLYYRNGRRWKEVEALTPYGTEKDCYNTLEFKPIKTTGLKIAAQLQEGESGGIIEWKVL